MPCLGCCQVLEAAVGADVSTFSADLKHETSTNDLRLHGLTAQSFSQELGEAIRNKINQHFLVLDDVSGGVIRV